MATKMFLNLPVKNLPKSIAFFTRLGFTFNAQFTDDKATCMIIGEDIFVMLLVEPFFLGFTKKQICDTAKSNEAIIGLSADSKAKTDEMADKAIKAGATAIGEPNDQGFMYSRSFHDLDGHFWEVFYMDPAAISQG
ncbi:MAG TPA: VOC family protein [Chitinophagaceae bacterium]|nr:VOC family protein [Chitinophagaceae bacterium]